MILDKHSQNSYSHSPFYRDTPVVLKKDDTHLVEYPHAIERMEQWRLEIINNHDAEYLWLLEHPPLITAGIRAQKRDLLKPDALPIFHTRRGGQYTYHGPGQRIAYLVLNLRKRRRDVHAFVDTLQQWIIQTLAHCNIHAFTLKNHIGVWVCKKNIHNTPDHSFSGLREHTCVPQKIAAIGVHLRHWVCIHGVAINISPSLKDFDAIVPCGITDYDITSIEKCGVPITMEQFDTFLCQEFTTFFGPLKPL